MNNLLYTTSNRWRQYVYSVLVITTVSAICFALAGTMGYRFAGFVLLFTISLLAITFDIYPVLLSAILSAFIWNFFFIPPRYTLHVGTSEDTILLIMYFIIVMINGVLTNKIRQIEKFARIREERANSVKLYNTVLNSLSHELRTPIAAIIAAADNLQLNNNFSTATAQQLIGEISKASLRLNQQVENLLNISRLESGHIKPKNDWCDIIELVYNVVQRVEEINPGRKVHINIQENLPLCSLDKGMLDQVVYNILNNAALHTPKDARIDITATCIGGLLRILIQDTGEGFKNFHVRDAFDKFSRDKDRRVPGAGLGLSIVKGFTEALRGTVALGKKHPNGLQFEICIPVKTTSLQFTNG
jgi:two-component system, OmpR family, sensor histidine kinase KdpD